MRTALRVHLEQIIITAVNQRIEAVVREIVALEFVREIFFICSFWLHRQNNQNGLIIALRY